MDARGIWESVLLGLCLSLGENAQSQVTRSSPDSASSSAQVALAVLRSQAQSDELVERFAVLPSTQLLNLRGAADALARLPKPVRCQGEYRNGVLVIDCKPIENSRIVELQMRFAQTCGEQWRDAVQRIWGDTIPDPVVLVRGVGDSFLVPLSAVVAFVRDYDIVFGLAVDSVPRNRLPRGANAVMVVSPAAKVQVHIRDASPPP